MKLACLPSYLHSLIYSFNRLRPGDTCAWPVMAVRQYKWEEVTESGLGGTGERQGLCARGWGASQGGAMPP